jgi:hypothetical protein
MSLLLAEYTAIFFVRIRPQHESEANPFLSFLKAITIPKENNKLRKTDTTAKQILFFLCFLRATIMPKENNELLRKTNTKAKQILSFLYFLRAIPS